MRKTMLKHSRHVRLPNGQELVLQAAIYGDPRPGEQPATIRGAVTAAILLGAISERVDRIFR